MPARTSDRWLGVVSAGLCPEVLVPRARQTAGRGDVLPRRHEDVRNAASQASRGRAQTHPGRGRAQGAGDRRFRVQHHGRPVVRQARIIPEKKMQEVGRLPWTVEGYGDHLGSWLKACREGTPMASNFAFAAAVTEVALLGSIALRHGRKLQWDAKNSASRMNPKRTNTSASSCARDGMCEKWQNGGQKMAARRWEWSLRPAMASRWR